MSCIIKVLIVDDHPVVRGGLRAALSCTVGIEVVGEAQDGLEAEDKALESRPDVVIMDINMPQRGGIETMLSIKQKLPDVKIILLTVSELEADLFRAVRSGADGYLLKNTGIEEVVGAIRKVITDEVVVSPLMASQLVKGLRGNGNGPVLSRREEEVLSLVGEGMTNSEIGKRLFLSPNTVNSYIQRLLDKLNLKNRAAAAAYAARNLNMIPR